MAPKASLTVSNSSVITLLSLGGSYNINKNWVVIIYFRSLRPKNSLTMCAKEIFIALSDVAFFSGSFWRNQINLYQSDSSLVFRTNHFDPTPDPLVIINHGQIVARRDRANHKSRALFLLARS